MLVLLLQFSEPLVDQAMFIRCLHIIQTSITERYCFCVDYLSFCRYIGQNRNIEVLNLCMCQGVTENALVPLCNSLHR